MAKILSKNDISVIENSIEYMKGSISSYLDNISTLLQHYNEDEIFTNLYKIGKFGEKERQEVIQISNGIKEFDSLINKKGGLIDRTLKFVEDAKALNTTGRK